MSLVPFNLSPAASAAPAPPPAANVFTPQIRRRLRVLSREARWRVADTRRYDRNFRRWANLPGLRRIRGAAQARAQQRLYDRQAWDHRLLDRHRRAATEAHVADMAEAMAPAVVYPYARARALNARAALAAVGADLNSRRSSQLGRRASEDDAFIADVRQRRNPFRAAGETARRASEIRARRARAARLARLNSRRRS